VRSTLKFIIALGVAFIIMLMFRALVFTIYTVPGSTLEPKFQAGDRVMVNRWSYGLRTGGGGLFSYGRLCRQTVKKGDWIAVDDSVGNVMIGCCTAQPGDTILWQERMVVVPGKVSCARHDYYHLDHVGLIREEQIIGRVVLNVFSHNPARPFWDGYESSRFLMPL
jgi:signal peptidase I